VDAPSNFDVITFATAIIGVITGILGSATGIIALMRDRPRLRLTREVFDEDRLRTERPDLRQPDALTNVPLDLSKPFYCLAVSNLGYRPVTILEAHAAFMDSEAGLRYHWNSHWFRSVQALELFDRDVQCVLDETRPVARFVYPADEGSKLLALTVSTPGRTYRYHPSFVAGWRYRLRRRKWRRVQAILAAAPRQANGVGSPMPPMPDNLPAGHSDSEPVSKDERRR
jgi:hypothetical protein